MHTYPQEVKDFIQKNVKGRKSTELTIFINETFGTNYGVNHIKAYMKNHGLKNGLDTKFKKGHEPQNKGKKGVYASGSEKGWFKKGQKPVNHKPVGSERIDRDGYVLIKTKEPNVWDLKHRVVWREHHGEIPKDQVVIFLDSNTLNTDISNLALITRSELKIMNQQGLKNTNAALTETGVFIARLTDKKFKLKRNKKRVIYKDKFGTEGETNVKS